MLLSCCCVVECWCKIISALNSQTEMSVFFIICLWTKYIQSCIHEVDSSVRFKTFISNVFMCAKFLMKPKKSHFLNK
jgi:hypothetical protein